MTLLREQLSISNTLIPPEMDTTRQSRCRIIPVPVMHYLAKFGREREMVSTERRNLHSGTMCLWPGEAMIHLKRDCPPPRDVLPRQICCLQVKPYASCPRLLGILPWYSSYYAALLHRRGPHIASHSVCLSICPSVRLSVRPSRYHYRASRRAT